MASLVPLKIERHHFERAGRFGFLADAEHGFLFPIHKRERTEVHIQKRNQGVEDVLENDVDITLLRSDPVLEME